MKPNVIRVILSLSTALLLWLAWPPGMGAPLIFIAFIPLLFLEKQFSDNPKRFGAAKFWALAYASMLVWNVLTTYWIYYAGAEGSYPAFIANALLMSLVWLFFHKAHRWWGRRAAYFMLCYGWVFFEWFHLNWDLSWPRAIRN
jgi:apolipoprotein N-acyltransferase